MSDNVNLKFRAFSDPIRLRILHLLRKGEICVGDLVRILDVPQPTASRHLGYLRDAELVVVRKEGRWAFYSLAEVTNSFHKSLLDCLGTCFIEVPELMEDAERLKELRESGEACCSQPET